MKSIGADTNKAAGEEIEALLNMHHDEIEKAYLRAEKSLTVPLKVKFSPMDDSESIEVEAFIDFVPEKIKDSVTRTITNQGDMFEDGKK